MADHQQRYVIEVGPDDAAARFSPCKRYRYQLHRWITDKRSSWRSCVFVMLNPSTADAFVLDPTVARCVKFARRWGFDRLDVVNIFALRSPYPADLYTIAANAPGPLVSTELGACDVNDAHIRSVCAAGERVIAAWGNHGHNAKLFKRGERVRAMLEAEDIELWHLGTSLDGAPLHPLARGKSHIPYEREPVRWA